MSKAQTLGLVGSTLTATGTVLATWGINDGHQWAPIVGIVLALVSLTWGLLHHKDPATPGTLKWSLVRKTINVAGSAAITYGFLNPERVQGIEVLAASLGPLLAAWFSWIDNETTAGDDGDPGPDGLHLLLALICLTALLLPSCADFPVTGSIQTPYGTITTDAKGGIVLAPRPIVIPQE
jgi:hypothetical protein